MITDQCSAVAGTLIGCSGCMIAIEALASSGGSSMHLMTFSTFLAITLEGLIRHSEYLKVRHIPYRVYVEVVTIFFIVSIANYQVVNFEVPFPLLIIFRSGTLLANVILTRLLQNRILLMIASLFGSAYMGLVQEKIYFKYGKHPDEMMFHTHFLSLPLFAFVGESIVADAVKYSNSPNFSVGFISLPIPTQWVNLALVIVMQLCCIRFVYRLSSQMNSLNLTMVLTLRKCLNLVLSFLLFKNTFTSTHFAASLMVFVGSFQFYEGFTKLFLQLRQSRVPNAKKEE
ncbi:UAA transporter family domain-containing protein [Ditylenchus destructor]|uniref:UAA transporter family domain-containing protein n=1 Tax=Ditylenchus destructor TaxID=166010 RepID=A0AAD4R2Q6_9BILA|nr:UAA transporter family domain-containing protein [Ditylenchus destructor]